MNLLSLIRVLSVHLMNIKGSSKLSSCVQQIFWLYWVNAKAQVKAHILKGVYVVE